jgi:hypothetical protein
MPTEEIKKTLTDYLVNTEPAPDAVVIVANDPEATPSAVEQEIINTVAAAAAETDPEVDIGPLPLDEQMTDLMAKVKRIGMCAKDLHYRAKGKPFYGLHQLADLAYEVESDTDQIAEIYFLGDRGIEPPRMDEVFTRACAVPVIYPKDDNYFIGGLMDCCRLTMHSIEDIKKAFPDIKSGVCAVLDKISEHCLLAIGLLDQTMKH